MDGMEMKAGAVGAERRLNYPVLLARMVMQESEHVLLVGKGAQKFAR